MSKRPSKTRYVDQPVPQTRYEDQPYYVRGWMDPLFWRGRSDSPTSVVQCLEQVIIHLDRGNYPKALWWIETANIITNYKLR